MPKLVEPPSTEAEVLDACAKFLAEHDQRNGGNYCAHPQNGERIAQYIHDHYHDHFTEENLQKAFQKLNADLKLIKTREEEAQLSADQSLVYFANNGERRENEFGKFTGWELPARAEMIAERPRQDGRVRSLAESRVRTESYPWENGETISPREYAALGADEVKELHLYLDRNNLAFSKVVR